MAAAGGDSSSGGGSSATVAFADDIFGAGPALVAVKPLFDEQQQRFSIFLNAIELICAVFIQQHTVASANWVYKHDICDIQQTVRIVNGLVGGQGGGTIGFSIEKAGSAKETCVDIHGGGAGSTVKTKENRTGGRILYIGAKIGIGENGSDGFPGIIIEHIIFTDSVVGNPLPMQSNLVVGFKFSRDKADRIHFFCGIHE